MSELRPTAMDAPREAQGEADQNYYGFQDPNATDPAMDALQEAPPEDDFAPADPSTELDEALLDAPPEDDYLRNAQSPEEPDLFDEALVEAPPEDPSPNLAGAVALSGAMRPDAANTTFAEDDGDFVGPVTTPQPRPGGAPSVIGSMFWNGKGWTKNSQ